MITIDTYTSTWDDAVRQRTALRAGMHVRIHESADDREFDAFRHRVRESGLSVDCHVRWMPRARMNVYRLTRSHAHY